jgi:hypothetical protein
MAVNESLLYPSSACCLLQLSMKDKSQQTHHHLLHPQQQAVQAGHLLLQLELLPHLTAVMLRHLACKKQHTINVLLFIANRVGCVYCASSNSN